VAALTWRTTVGGGAAGVSAHGGGGGGSGELLLSPRLVLDRDTDVGDGSSSSSNGDSSRPLPPTPFDADLPAPTKPVVSRLRPERIPATSSTDRDETLLPTGSSAYEGSSATWSKTEKSYSDRKTETGSSATWSAIGSVRE